MEDLKCWVANLCGERSRKKSRANQGPKYLLYCPKLQSRSETASLNTVPNSIIEYNQQTGIKGNESINTRALKNFHYSSISDQRAYRSNSGLIGLRNMGGTCYASTALQCLSNTIFCTLICNVDNAENSRLVEAVAKIFSQKAVNKIGEGEYLELLHLIGNINPIFNQHGDQDSLEFLRTLLTSLNHALNRVTLTPKYKRLPNTLQEGQLDHELAQEWHEFKMSKANSVVSDLFCGQMMNVKNCQKCRKSKYTFTTFWDLLLSPKKDEDEDKMSLEHILLNHINAKEEEYNCEICGTIQKFTEYSRMTRLPEILIIGFKRFEDSEYGWIKSHYNISFPGELNIHDYANVPSHFKQEDCKYKLVGQVHHSGTLNQGHFIAYLLQCEDGMDGNWHEFNDSVVSRKTDLDHKGKSTRYKKAAYYLIYTKLS